MVHSRLKVSHYERDAVQSLCSQLHQPPLLQSLVRQPPLDSSTPWSAYFKGHADYYGVEWAASSLLCFITDVSKDLKW